MQAPIIIINGPNLNLLGRRETGIYGDQSFDDFFDQMLIDYPNLNILYFQSNHEGVLIDLIQEYGFTARGIILNAAAYTHTSIAIADAIKAIETPVIEVHISDINKREEFRTHSYLTPVCKFHVIGKGLAGYNEALEYLISNY